MLLFFRKKKKPEVKGLWWFIKQILGAIQLSIEEFMEKTWYWYSLILLVWAYTFSFCWNLIKFLIGLPFRLTFRIIGFILNMIYKGIWQILEWGAFVIVETLRLIAFMWRFPHYGGGVVWISFVHTLLWLQFHLYIRLLWFDYWCYRFYGPMMKIFFNHFARVFTWKFMFVKRLRYYYIAFIRQYVLLSFLDWLCYLDYWVQFNVYDPVTGKLVIDVVGSFEIFFHSALTMMLMYHAFFIMSLYFWPLGKYFYIRYMTVVFYVYIFGVWSNFPWYAILIWETADIMWWTSHWVSAFLNYAWDFEYWEDAPEGEEDPLFPGEEWNPYLMEWFTVVWCWEPVRYQELDNIRYLLDGWAYDDIDPARVAYYRAEWHAGVNRELVDTTKGYWKELRDTYESALFYHPENVPGSTLSLFLEKKESEAWYKQSLQNYNMNIDWWWSPREVRAYYWWFMQNETLRQRAYRRPY